MCLLDEAPLRLRFIRESAEEVLRYVTRCEERIALGMHDAAIISNYSELMAQTGNRIRLQSDALVRDLERHRER